MKQSTLTKGTTYDIKKLKHIGWTDGDRTGHEGYHFIDFFEAVGASSTGKYLGPDCHGIEPLFEFAPNYRIYDQTGGGCTHDIYAETLEDAIDAGREWIEAGDWERGSDEQTLECAVSEIVRCQEDGEIDDAATREAERHDCSGTLAAKDAPECLDGDSDGHDWQSPHSVVGGCKENPGVWGSGHGQIKMASVCACCGLIRTTDYGATNSSNGTKTTRTTYADADEASITWLMRRLNLPASIEIKGAEVTLEWDTAADIRQDRDEVGTATHTVPEADMDAGVADGPKDGEIFEIEGVKFKLGAHGYETNDGETTCSASIYRVL